MEKPTIHTYGPPKLDRKQELGPVGRYQVAITTAPANDIYEIIIDTITGDIVHRYRVTERMYKMKT